MNHDDHEIAFVYKDSVIGKDVWLQFPVEDGRSLYYRGKITRFEMLHQDDDVSKPLEYRHYVVFGDSDDGYYDLSLEEMTGKLAWEEPDEDFLAATSETEDQQGTFVGATRTPPGTEEPAAVPVTPVKRSRSGPPREQSSRSNKKKRQTKIKLEPGAVALHILRDDIDLDEFSHWLRYIHKGKNGEPISNQNANSVINRVRDLISGRGISYKNWPSGVAFHEGDQMDLNTDYKSLLQDAKAFEARNGRDLGNGWLLQHPIKKLLLFQKYIRQKRHEREHPHVVH